MKDRSEVAQFINSQLDYKVATVGFKCNRVRYGRQEFKDLLDFIYGGPPYLTNPQCSGCLINQGGKTIYYTE